MEHIKMGNKISRLLRDFSKHTPESRPAEGYEKFGVNDSNTS